MVEQREIVIIGAGPAGSAAAREAARRGLCPLLLDKETSPGARNACGGFAAHAYRRALELPEDVIEGEICTTLLRMGRRAHYCTGRQPMYISFHRRMFDAFLARRAVEAGAELVTRARARIADAATRRVVFREGPEGREREVCAQVLIFADGPSTMAVRAYGIGHRPGPRTRQALVVELEGPAARPEIAEVVVDPTARSTGYFWIFPKRDRLNVGVGGPRVTGEPSLAVRLGEFIESRPDLRGRRVLSRLAGLVPIERAERLVAPGVMAVGDAAGLVNPITGGGIAFALLSGEIAGRTAADAVRAGRVDEAALTAYPRRLRWTPHYAWLAAMTHWRRRLDKLAPAQRAAAHGRMLEQYFDFFTGLRWLVEAVLR